MPLKAKFKKLTFKSRKQKLSIAHLNPYFYSAKQLFLKTTLLNLILWCCVGQIGNGADGLQASNHFSVSQKTWHSYLSSLEHGVALNPSLWNNHLQCMEWQESKATPHRAIPLDRGNVWASWEWGRLRVPGSGQPVQKWQPWACINESHGSHLKWQDWCRNSNELISVGERNISFKWAAGWIWRYLALLLAITPHLFYNLPQIVPPL